MTSHPPGVCCVSGPALQPEPSPPRGEIKTYANLQAYISHPAPEHPSLHSEKAILYLSDACGFHIPASQHLADAISAAMGVTVVMPDLFHGDPHPFNDETVDLEAWLAKHPSERVDPVVEATLRYMRETMGMRMIGAVGYCFGAKYVVRYLGRDQGIDAGFVAHPSFVTREELEAIKGPLSIAAAESDYIFNDEKRHESEGILKKLDVAWQICLYSDVEHSFAVRGNPEVRREVWAKKQALQQALQWFEEHLGE